MQRLLGDRKNKLLDKLSGRIADLDEAFKVASKSMSKEFKREVRETRKFIMENGDKINTKNLTGFIGRVSELTGRVVRGF